jgi:uncharacterized membrane protein
MNAAYFHIALVHLPVVLCPLGAILLAVAHLRHSLPTARVGLAVLLAASVIVIPVFLLGEPAEEIVEHLPGISEATIEKHEESAEAALWLTLAAGALSIIAWICISAGARLERIALALTFIVSTLASAALAFTAHRGGAIRHPEAFAAPQAHTEEVENQES